MNMTMTNGKELRKGWEGYHRGKSDVVEDDYHTTGNATEREHRGLRREIESVLLSIGASRPGNLPVPGGELFAFEHAGHRYYIELVTPIAEYSVEKYHDDSGVPYFRDDGSHATVAALDSEVHRMLTALRNLIKAKATAIQDGITTVDLEFRRQAE